MQIFTTHQFRSIITLIALFTFSIVNGQIMTTIAGTGSGGYSGDGGLATSANVQRPIEIHRDASGNIFIADNDNHRIRKIDGVTGIITTVAGDGSFGFSGDGAVATDAQLALPTAVCTDPSGNIFISDENNRRIRKVDVATGFISTIAGNGTGGYSGDGGPSVDAMISQPYGMQTDDGGSLFFADRANHRIRRIDKATGIITTVAGSGTNGYSGDGGLATAADLSYPIGLCLDPMGNIYIADQINHRIRKVDKATGIITTVAGSGTNGYSGDGGLATDAELNQPYDVSIDAAGNLYISDTNNQRIRRVSAVTGIITTIGGNGSGGYGGDGGPATDASMNYPSGIFADAQGNVYIGDKLNHRVRKISSCSSAASIDEIACFEYITPSGNDTLTTSGTFTDVIPNANGCDSVLTINLTINSVDTSVTVSGITLSSNVVDASFQWLDCGNDFEEIDGETSQSFAPTASGNYAVEVTENGCVAISSCYWVIIAGVKNYLLAENVKVFPNPTAGSFSIDLENVTGLTELSIRDIHGRLVYIENIENKKQVEVSLNQSAGVYFLTLKSEKGIIVRKIVKE
jgi:sugar lactone lactonase YvrE